MSKPDIQPIKNHRQLTERLIVLEARKEKAEAALLLQVSEINALIKDPAPLVKQTISKLAGDKNFKVDALKIGANLVASYAMGKGGIVPMLINKVIAAKEDDTMGKIKNWFTTLLQKIKKTD